MNNQDTDKYTVIFDCLGTPSPHAATHDATVDEITPLPARLSSEGARSRITTQRLNWLQDTVFVYL